MKETLIYKTKEQPNLCWARNNGSKQVGGGVTKEKEANWWWRDGREVKKSSGLCALKRGRTVDLKALLFLLLENWWITLSTNKARNKQKCQWIYAFFLWERQPLYKLLWLPELHPSPGRAVPAKWWPTIDLTCPAGFISHISHHWLISLVVCSGD